MKLRDAYAVDLKDGTTVTLRPLTDTDHDALFALFARIVDDKEGWPQTPPLDHDEFEHVWLDAPMIVIVAEAGDELVGAYLLKPNHPGRASHIANCGYISARAWRGRGVGRALVEDSIERARAAGFDAIQFNLVFESNPARKLYEELGWEPIGRLPDAVEGEAAIIYWRPL
jgi:ribosomal protein S18 acetylase RimI-like enzyme